MEKRNRAHRFFKIALIAISTPIAIMALLIAMLYVPFIQRFVADKVCNEISATSGYDIKVNSIGLRFPLKLEITGFSMSKGDSVYLKSERFDADISLLPLFTGDVEVNHVTLEGVDIHTRDMMTTARIDGKVGYARLVARDADLKNSVVDVRQLHIQEADILVTLPDSIADDDSEMPLWLVNLHQGTIKDSRIAVSLPSDTLNASLNIGKLRVNDGCFNMSTNSYAIGSIALSGSQLNYDQGYGTNEEAPLRHIGFRDIMLNAGELSYAGDDISASISRLTMEQPGGLTITGASAHLTSNKDTLLLHGLEINSRNGSHIYGNCTIPWLTLSLPTDESFTASLQVELNKHDLAKFIQPKEYENLRMFDENMLNAQAALSGNVHNIGIDTLTLEFPGLGNIGANGYIKNLAKREKIVGHLALGGEVTGIARIMNYGSNTDDNISIDGDINYAHESIDATLALSGACGYIDATGSYNIADTVYKADVSIRQLALDSIMPDIPLHNLTMNLKAKGKGIDIFDKTTGYSIDIAVDTLYYSSYRLRALTAKATQANGISLIDVEGNDESLSFDISATTHLEHKGIENHTTIELALADFKELGLIDGELKASTSIDITAASDLKETHSLKMTGENTRIHTKENRFTPENLLLDFATSPKETNLLVKNGDLEINGSMECGYNALFAAIDNIRAMYRELADGKELYYLNDFEKRLPHMDIHVTCGENNMLHNFLAYKGIYTKSIALDADIAPVTGLNITGDIYKLSSNGITLDSIRILTRQDGDRLNYHLGIDNLSIAPLEEENSYNATLDGHIASGTMTAGLALSDNIEELESRIGASARLTPQLMSLSFDREALLLGKPFTFSKDNYINIGKGMAIDADVAFTGNSDNGFHLYTTADDYAEYNITLELFNIGLTDITSSIPGLPSIGGKLLGNINCRSTADADISLTGDINVDNMSYEGNTIGNERVAVLYTSSKGENDNIDIALSHNNTKVAHISGGISANGTAPLNGKMSLTRFPLAITKAFAGEDGIIMDGYLNSDISFSGTLDNLSSNGFLKFDSTYIYIPFLGATLHPDEENIMIEKSEVKFNRFHIYDKANSPFVINGTANIANLLNPVLSLRLIASNYEVLNTPYIMGKTIYGNMFVDLRSIISGTLDNLKMTGDVSILSNSNFAYVLPETAFETEKELDGLVEFVNFSDTATVVQEKAPEFDLGNINANFNIYIKEGAKVALDFDKARENYIVFNGDGNLNATYDESGLNVTGIYKLNGGQLKLTLPIIPLKTFYIQEGGRLTWTGDLYDPTLDITALEKTTVSVEFEDNSIQPVTFNAGVVLSNTVNNLGIDFTMSSPENTIIQEQLNQLDQETLSKYAVAMIITGTYMGGRQGVTATSALSSFLDAKLNDLTGTAIKNFDVNIGINDGLDATTGSNYRNYSFSFSKRFFNDRITVVIGGEVNSSDRPDRNATNNSFINNVSLEWKLNESGNRYIRIFYDKDYRSILEGEITETGIGYVYKRKLNKLKELFNFKKKSKKANTGDEKREGKQ